MLKGTKYQTLPIGTRIVMRQDGSHGIKQGHTLVITRNQPDADGDWRCSSPGGSKNFIDMYVLNGSFVIEDSTETDISHAALKRLAEGEQLVSGDVLMTPNMHLGIVMYIGDDGEARVLNTGVNYEDPDARGSLGKVTWEHIQEKDLRVLHNIFDIYESLPLVVRERMNKKK